MAKNIIIRNLTAADNKMLSELKAESFHDTNSKVLLEAGYSYLKTRQHLGRVRSELAAVRLKYEELLDAVLKRQAADKNLADACMKFNPADEN